MTDIEREDDDTDATAEQLAALRELGVEDSEMQDLTFSAAEEWIEDLRAMREDAGKISRE